MNANEVDPLTAETVAVDPAAPDGGAVEKPKRRRAPRKATGEAVSEVDSGDATQAPPETNPSAPPFACQTGLRASQASRMSRVTRAV